MESLDMNQNEMAQRTGLSIQTVIRILKGEQPITYETANKLELVTNVPAQFWNNLEALYRDQLAKSAEREQLRHGIEWLKTIPTKELIDRGEINHHADKILLLRETLAFYGVSSVEAWHKLWDRPQVAARRSPCFESQPGPASAWIRIGERRAHKTTCADYDKDKFLLALKTIRGLTTENPDVFIPEMTRLCAESGVALALVQEFKKVPWSGATKWLMPRKAMILLNLRGKGEDKFWFSFYHEAGHVVHDKKKDLLINDGTSDDPREKRANEFASNFLIPKAMNSRISSVKSTDEIKEIARTIEISEGIVAGRFQFLTKNWKFYKNLIRSFDWAAINGIN
jgi:plasmid maintenance system antidote protein VapI